ncbi:ABC transporter ATP-binding protein [Halobacillus campisalis]|uniref:ABC transporter ATP-binding protein n=1 Tax=Halobacillus campisalis TaxID=435909 RepID=A0ABW2K255_9BACI|nr:ABC transporter ATP-binding protein [Halobacillus campisalis]
MNKEIIRAENLSLYYEEMERPVFINLSFQIHACENVLILGPSGSGKSSLIQCLNGLYPRELDGTMKGSVTVNGKSTRDFQPGAASKHVGVVFQDPETQFCMLTVEDEIAFGLENLRIPVQEMEAIIDDVLHSVGLFEFKSAQISKLSGGQKQKLALACILAMEPEVIILDEPTANLDPVASKDFVVTLSALKRKRDFALIVIEHQLDDWVTLLERAFILQRDGTCLYDGPLRKGMELHAASLQKQGIWMPFAAQTAIKKKIAFHRLPLHLEELVNVNKPEVLNVSHPASRHKPGDVLLEAYNVSWKKVVKSITLQIHQHEFIAIVGANGSGKTSLSRLLAGIAKPSKGKISFQGKLLSQWKERHLYEKLGYVFQNPEHQFITDSVYEEIAFGLRIKYPNNQEAERKTEKVLSQFHLEQWKHHHPFALSQGQKRRLSVAAMLASDQSLLFLDEPTFGQDAASTDNLMELLMNKYNKGTSIVMITHDMNLVDQFATRVLVMDEGRIAVEASPAELWERGDLGDFQLTYPNRIDLARMLEKRKDSYVPS